MPDANGVIHPVVLSVPADKWERIFGTPPSTENTEDTEE